MTIYSRKHTPTGFYVYAYIRSTDSKTAKSGTPYYIGMGKKQRAWKPHRRRNSNTELLPKNKNCIVIITDDLTLVGAIAMERRLIRWYGRKDISTGILTNMTDGGEGGYGRRINEYQRQVLRLARNGQGPSKEAREKAWETRRGAIDTQETRRKKSESNKGKPKEIVQCPHCEKTGGLGAMYRWHFDNCRRL